MENFREYYYLNIIVNISTFSPLNTNVKYFRKQALKKKLKLMGGVMKFFTKNLLGYEIFSSMVPLGYEMFFEIFVKPSGPHSYILNERSLATVVHKQKAADLFRYG